MQRYLFSEYMTLLNVSFFRIFSNRNIWNPTFEMQRYLCDVIKTFLFPVFKKKEKKENADVEYYTTYPKTPEKRAANPTSGCACAHPREPLRGHVTDVTTSVKGPIKADIAQLLVALARTQRSPLQGTRDHFRVRSGPLPVMSLPLALPRSTSANMTWTVLIWYSKG